MRKVALITGSNSNLGALLVKEFLQEGYRVYAGVRNTKEIRPREGLIPVKLDITSDRDCQMVVRRIEKEIGKIDVLVNNAGYTLTGPTDEFKVKDYLDILNVNTVGAFRLIKLVTPLMRRQKSGKIINITSLNGLVSLPNFGLYSSSKHALEALGQALRYELIGDNIFVTSITPGAIYRRSLDKKELRHKPLREKFKFLYTLLPMITGEKVARKVVEIAGSQYPPARVILGRDAVITTLLQKFMPTFVWDRLMKYIWGKK